MYGALSSDSIRFTKLQLSGALSVMDEDQMKVHFKSSFICGTTSARIGICHKHLLKM